MSPKLTASPKNSPAITDTPPKFTPEETLPFRADKESRQGALSLRVKQEKAQPQVQVLQVPQVPQVPQMQDAGTGADQVPPVQ